GAHCRPCGHRSRTQDRPGHCFRLAPLLRAHRAGNLMTYISLILAILITRFAPGLCGSWGDVAFRHWQNLVRPAGRAGMGDDLRFYAMIALPVVVLAVGLALLHKEGWRFAGYAIGFLVLLCCFGV